MSVKYSIYIHKKNKKTGGVSWGGLEMKAVMCSIFFFSLCMLEMYSWFFIDCDDDETAPCFQRWCGKIKIGNEAYKKKKNEYSRHSSHAACLFGSDTSGSGGVVCICGVPTTCCPL